MNKDTASRLLGGKNKTKRKDVSNGGKGQVRPGDAE
jgi:hypothetical protein